MEAQIEETEQAIAEAEAELENPEIVSDYQEMCIRDSNSNV